MLEFFIISNHIREMIGLICFNLIVNLLSCVRGGGGGRGDLRVILVRVGGPVFGNLPHSYTWSSKKDLFIHLIEQNVYIFIYCSLIFIYPLCCL